MAAIVSKRKRDSQDMPNMRAPPGMNLGGHEFEQQYFHTEGDGMDATDANIDFAGMLAQHNADPSGPVEDEQDADQDEQQAQVVGGGGQSASDTAAAAMAQFHTMTVPQTTEQTFMQQQANAEGAGDRQDSPSADPTSAQQRTSSFGDFDVNTMKEGQTTQNGQTSPTDDAGSMNPNGPKPAVGSDEWHKVRRDNHKEGKLPFQFAATYGTTAKK